ncbi:MULTISPECIES: hypothetical protein [Actinokineospora]|uniref:Uncharacterized protein n=1 Tax=Actinokineospora fastidiosa TaxID=1816 RepID=A0A918LCK7_9PSEU|nr:MULTISPECIES: hypothetical protein [Actinokineospora]UVS79908.1 hypothetical protein Actkin_03658 [Actinokineospora sp. UTMC 2448]GGS31689.1 hypothetical protein GCM10010171_26980 [Actinokineospora fastidiosa]
MDDGTYLAILVLGVVLVAVDAAIIYRSGLRYLVRSYADPASAKSMARLVTTLFSIAVLGVLLLITATDIGEGDGVQAIALRLGIVLILIAVAHAITIKVLTRMRDRLDTENKTKQHYGDPSTRDVPDVPPQSTVRRNVTG